VFVGSIMGSSTTAAATGTIGLVRRDPMAMLPFCGYHMGDYLAHWLEMGERLSNPPKIFNVNWFRLDEDLNFIWPGYGENMRVLDWVLRRSFGEVEAVESPIGWLPKAEDINLEGMENFSFDSLKTLLSVNNALWRDEAKDIREFYAKFGDKLPARLEEELAALEKKLEKI